MTGPILVLDVYRTTLSERKGDTIMMRPSAKTGSTILINTAKPHYTPKIATLVP